MPIEPVKIPQNVYIEDRIIGPITLRQIIMLLAGGGISYVIWTILKKAGQDDIISQLLSWTPLGIMAIFAFVKINGISLLRFCFLLYESTQKPKVRIWQPRVGITVNPTKLVQRADVKDSMVHRTDEKAHNIDQLSSVLDSGPLPTAKKSTESPVTNSIDTITAEKEKRVIPSPRSLVRDITPPTPQHG